MGELAYERVEHTADLAIRVWGPDLPGLFINAALALFDLMTEPPATADRERIVTLESVDAEALLVDWLNELIFLNEVEKETYVSFTFDAFSPDRLTARLKGGPTSRRIRGIKAATFHNLAIQQTDTGCETTIVFDV